jgi:PIN domain nuclease of toxin-antitoxin system
MRLLLDTKVMLWALQDYSSLGINARLQMKHAEVIYISAASVWEVEVKLAAGKLTLHGDLLEALEDTGFKELPITWVQSHGLSEVELEDGDGFDRMLLAQAHDRQLMLVTADDEMLRLYPDMCIDARA